MPVVPHGLVLAPIDWQKEVAVPNMNVDPLVEIRELGSGWCRETFDEMIRRFFKVAADSCGYSVAVAESKDPIKDHFYHQARIWWKSPADRPVQPLTLLDLLWEFEEGEQKWYREIGGSEGVARELGVPEPSLAVYESLWLYFGWMRVSVAWSVAYILSTTGCGATRTIPWHSTPTIWENNTSRLGEAGCVTF